MEQTTTQSFLKRIHFFFPNRTCRCSFLRRKINLFWRWRPFTFHETLIFSTSQQNNPISFFNPNKYVSSWYYQHLDFSHIPVFKIASFTNSTKVDQGKNSNDLISKKYCCFFLHFDVEVVYLSCCMNSWFLVFLKNYLSFKYRLSIINEDFLPEYVCHKKFLLPVFCSQGNILLRLSAAFLYIYLFGCKMAIFLHKSVNLTIFYALCEKILLVICVVWWKIYAVFKNFTQPLVAPVVTNIMSAHKILLGMMCHLLQVVLEIQR